MVLVRLLWHVAGANSPFFIVFLCRAISGCIDFKSYVEARVLGLFIELFDDLFVLVVLCFSQAQFLN